MEMGGKYDTNHSYEYVDLEEEITPPTNLYNGPGPCLRCGVAECIKNLLDAVSICSRFNYNFIKRVTTNSNEYARSHLDSRVICIVTSHNLILYIDNGNSMPRSPLNGLSDPI